MQKVSLCFLMLLLTACSFDFHKNENKVKLAIQLPVKKFAQQLNAKKTLPSPRTESPSSLAEFNCFGVNITGPGINPSSSVVPLCPNDPTSYIGTWAGTVPTSGGTIELQVATGPTRSVQVFGIKTDAGTSCPTTDQIIAGFQTQGAGVSFSRPMELGRTTASITTNTTLTIDVSYNATSPINFPTCATSSGSATAAVWDQGVWDVSKWQ